MRLVARGVEFSYPRTPEPVLRGVEFDVPAGSAAAHQTYPHLCPLE